MSCHLGLDNKYTGHYKICNCLWSYKPLGYCLNKNIIRLNSLSKYSRAPTLGKKRNSQSQSTIKQGYIDWLAVWKLPNCKLSSNSHFEYHSKFKYNC
jgi:hypothetical protein